MSATTIAVVQRPPALLDREASFARAAEAIEEAAAAGAGLVVFPESFVGGYPDWAWRARPNDFALNGEIHARLVERASIDLARDEARPLREAAARAKVHVVCGIHERDGEHGRTTLYNSVVLIGADGALLNRHRKLVPTNPERMVWGQGDASGLRVAATPVGRIGALLCWENYMPLARFALYADGVEIYCAPTWDHGETWTATMRHIAREGRVWVVGACYAMQAKEVPADFPGRDSLYPDPEEWINPGDSLVVDPTGKIVAGPLHRECGILYASCDVRDVARARRSFDLAGHYGRPDLFRLEVDRTPRAPITFRDGREPV